MPRWGTSFSLFLPAPLHLYIITLHTGQSNRVGCRRGLIFLGTAFLSSSPPWLGVLARPPGPAGSPASLGSDFPNPTSPKCEGTLPPTPPLGQLLPCSHGSWIALWCSWLCSEPQAHVASCLLDTQAWTVCLHRGSDMDKMGLICPSDFLSK